MGRRVFAVAVVVGLCAVVRPSAYRAPAYAGAGLGAQGAGAVSAAGAPKGQDSAVPDRALLDRYCVGCHNQRTVAQGRPAFDQLDLAQVAPHAAILEKILKKLRSGQMPPDGSRRPDQAAI